MYQLLIPQILKMVIYMVVGFALGKTRLINAEQSKSLSLLCLYAAVPSAILSGFQKEYSPEILHNLLMTFVVVALIHVLFFGINWLLKRMKYSPVERLSVIYPNCGNLVIPLVIALLGTEYVIYSCVFIAMQSFLLWTHALSTLTGQRQMDLKKTITNPSVVAFFLGLVLFFGRIQLPTPVCEVLEVFSGFTGPLAMIVAGILLSGIKKEQLLAFRRLPLVILLRLVVVPVVLLAALRFSGIDGLLHTDPKILTVCFLSCITPPASTVVQMAQVFTDDATYASALNAVGMTLCIVSMPLMVLLYDMV